MTNIDNYYLQQGLKELHQAGDRQTSRSALLLDAGLQSGMQEVYYSKSIINTQKWQFLIWVVVFRV